MNSTFTFCFKIAPISLSDRYTSVFIRMAKIVQEISTNILWEIAINIVQEIAINNEIAINIMQEISTNIVQEIAINRLWSEAEYKAGGKVVRVCHH